MRPAAEIEGGPIVVHRGEQKEHEHNYGGDQGAHRARKVARVDVTLGDPDWATGHSDQIEVSFERTTQVG